MGTDDVNARKMRGENVDPFGDAKPMPEVEDNGPRLGTIGVDKLFEPLPPIPWLVQNLRMAPGAPIALAGYGFSGKTLFAQEIALCVAAGKPIFGLHSSKHGRALHIDFEQGRRITSERYQRLARAKGIEPCALEGRLHAAVLPAYALDRTEAKSVYKRSIDGFDFVTVDSLRAACPGADENSSEIRVHIDTLTRVSEETGATILFIHHSKKPGEHDTDVLDKMMLRGSSSIFDACSTVFTMGAPKNAPSRVSHHKCRHMGTTIEDFGIRVEDVAEGANLRAGLRLVHLGIEQLNQQADPKGAARLDGTKTRIVGALEKAAGRFAGNKSALQQRLGMKAQDFQAAFAELEGAGRVKVESKPQAIVLTGRAGTEHNFNVD